MQLPLRLVVATAMFVAGGLTCPRAARAQDTGLFLNINPPGQSGYLNTSEALDFLAHGTLPPHVDDQRPMYESLVHAQPGLSESDLSLYFKTATIGTSANPPDQLFPPVKGLTITRDEFGVPHIRARGRRKAWYGVGWAMAADKLFAMDLARRAGRGKLAATLGANPVADAELIDFALDQDEAMYQFAGFDETDLDAGLLLMREEYGARARRVQRELDAFLKGVNAFVDYVNTDPVALAPGEHVLLGLLPVEGFTKRDILAIATILEQLFGAGGGAEHRNAVLLQKLQAEYGAVDGEALFRDLRNAEEPEAPVTTELEFPFPAPAPVDPAAVALVDVGSVVTPPLIQITGPLPAPLAGLAAAHAERAPVERYHPAMSNFLAVTSEHAAGGHPIAVMGPQVAYFVPSLLTEISVEATNRAIRTRGVAVTGTPFVVLGRGESFAWSATAGGSDVTDTRVEKLCEPGGGTPSIMSKHYLFDGECRPMFERIDSWCIGSAAFCATHGDNAMVVVERTVHGLVFGRATVGGEPVALAKQRATFMREGQNGMAFSAINRRKTRSFRNFERAARLIPGSFNWLYVNEDELGYVHSGRFALRAPGVDPDLPSWGTGEWEWRGLLDHRERPQELNPERGFFTSWNNKPARGWRANDGNYSFGSVHRVDSLDDRVEAAVASGTPITVAEMVEFMSDAATVDLRGSQVLPHALAIIGSEPALDPVLAVLSDWVGAGAFRRDRDDDGEYDRTSAVAIMDEWFDRMIDAVFGAQLGNVFADIPMGRDNRPGPLGSAWQSGYYGYLQKTFRMALGASVTAPYEVLRCADGTLAGCRAALVSSLGDAVAALTTEFASADPADWRADPAVDQIEFTPFGVAAVDPIQWTNRPTFQQVVQVTAP